MNSSICKNHSFFIVVQPRFTSNRPYKSHSVKITAKSGVFNQKNSIFQSRAEKRLCFSYSKKPVMQRGTNGAGSGLVTHVCHKLWRARGQLWLHLLHLKPAQSFLSIPVFFKGCFPDHLQLNSLCSYRSHLLPAHPLLYSPCGAVARLSNVVPNRVLLIVISATPVHTSRCFITETYPFLYGMVHRRAQGCSRNQAHSQTTNCHASQVLKPAPMVRHMPEIHGSTSSPCSLPGKSTLAR